MKSVRVHQFGGPDVLRVDEVAMPTPGPGEARIQVRVAGVNYTDLLQRAGKLPGLPGLPFAPGVEAAGVVDAVGTSVPNLAPGARVVAMLPAGAFAEYAIAPASNVTVIPDDISFEQAVALPVQAAAALLALRRGAKLRERESIFIPAAGGGLGAFLVQLAKQLGASRIIAGASSQPKRALAQRLGADVVIDYTKPEWPELVREATDGRGVDIALVIGGGESVAQTLRTLAHSGRIVLLGVDTMLDTQLSREQVATLLAQNQSLVGFASFTLPPDELRAAFKEVLALAQRGTLEVVVGHTFALDELPEAHRLMEARQTTGKVIIRTSRL